MSFLVSSSASLFPCPEKKEEEKNLPAPPTPLTFRLVVPQVRHLAVDQDARLPLVAAVRGAHAHEPRRPRPRAEAPARRPGPLALERGLDLLARPAHEVRHGRVGVLGEREVGRAVRRVPPEEADGGPVVRPRGGLLGLVVADRDPRLAEAGDLDLHAPLALLLVEGDAAEAGLEGAVGRARGAGRGRGGAGRRGALLAQRLLAVEAQARRGRGRAGGGVRREGGGGVGRRRRRCGCGCGCGRGRRDAAAVGELGLGRHFLTGGGRKAARSAEEKKSRERWKKSCCRKACGRET